MIDVIFSRMHVFLLCDVMRDVCCVVLCCVGKACCLMVFSEETSTLVLGEVSQRLHLPDDTVKRILHSLSCGKYKVLKREGEGGSIKATDKVCDVLSFFSCSFFLLSFLSDPIDVALSDELDRRGNFTPCREEDTERERHRERFGERGREA